MLLAPYYIAVLPKWNGNSVNAGHLINPQRMNWGQFKDPFCYLYHSGAVITFCFLYKRFVGSNSPFDSNSFVTVFAEFRENISGKL